MFANQPAMAKRWVKETPRGGKDLPARAPKKQKRGKK